MTEAVNTRSDGQTSGLASVGAVLRTRLFELTVLVWSLPFGVVILTYFQVRRVPAEVRWALRLWSSGFVWAARTICGVHYMLDGLDRVPDGPVVFVSNHQSYWESIAFTALFADINVITKSEAMDIPIFGWGLREAPMIPVFREQKGRNLRRIVKECRESLASGRSILLFPEGTRVKPGQTKPFLRGLGLLYASTNATIIPVVNNAGHCWTEGFQVKKPGHIIMRFCEPIVPGRDPAETATRLERTLNREKELLPGGSFC
ncbi:MAG: lysophospholipid acyltransferase family protein [Pseudomonadota bacterium]